MALIKGICKNYGECDLADEKVVQEVDKTNFVCEECGRNLYPLEGNKDEGGKRKVLNTKLIAIIVTVVAMLAIGGVIYTFGIKGTKKIPTAIRIDKTTLEMTVGKTELIVPSVDPEGVKANFTFKVSDKNIVAVTTGGEVTALKKGETNIIVKCEENPEIRAICKVTVIAKPDSTGPEPILVKDLTINDKELSLKQGDSKQLSITVVPENHDETLVWSTDDKTVATIDGEGNVTAHKEGTTNITISASQSGISANVKVTVLKENKTETNEGNGRSEKNPTWGKYTGSRDTNGLPHGNGILNITRSTTIKGETAYPGERIEGVFRNGYVNMGTWYKKDGNAVVIKDLKVY